MTNKEALEILTHNWTKLVNPDCTDEELGQALDMAIKALDIRKTFCPVEFPTEDDPYPVCSYTRSQGDLADEVWKLYEKHHSHLATYVIEFGNELKELLSKYQKGGVE